MLELSVANVVQKDFPECQEEEIFFFFSAKSAETSVNLQK